MRYLDRQDLLDIARVVLGGEPKVRDVGVLDTAAHRLRAPLYGMEALPTLHMKAAALADYLARFNPLTSGNKRLAYAAVKVFYGLNGFWLIPDRRNEAIDLFVLVASGDIGVDAVANNLKRWTRPLPSSLYRLP